MADSFKLQNAPDLTGSQAVLARVRNVLRHPATRLQVIAGITLLAAVVTGAVYYGALSLPAQSTNQQTPKTAVARRGSIILSAA